MIDSDFVPYRYVKVFPPDVMAGLSYDQDRGTFSHPVLDILPFVGKNGVLQIVIGELAVPAHRLAMSLMGVEIAGSVVCHLDGDKTNNSLANLRVMSRREYNQFAFDSRRAKRLGFSDVFEYYESLGS